MDTSQIVILATCPHCGQQYQDRENAEYIEENGMCLNCDHLRAEEAYV